MTTSESLALDVVRILASAVVAFGHLTQRYFSTAWPSLIEWAINAVAVFFVLSGFVIRYVTCRRKGTMRGYLADRASRIYSIAIPALIVTVVCDSIAYRVNPGFYAFWASNASHPVRRALVQLGTNLVFCGQIWSHPLDPLSNSPYWSVNYEVAYYLIYAFGFYLLGARKWFAIAAVCLIFGPQVVYLFPLWLLGCYSHDLYQRWNAAGTAARNVDRILLLCLFLAVPFTFAGIRFETAYLFHHLPTGLRFPVEKFVVEKRMKPLNYLFGLVWVPIFMRILLLARRIHVRSESKIVPVIRFISEGTFPLYLLHFPLYVLIAACISYNHASPWPKVTIFVSVLALGILAGHPGNLLKNKLRATFKDLG